MKLATLRNGRPDGQLVVVSSDLTRCVSAGRIAPSLQTALDNWDVAAPALRDLSAALNERRIGSQAFDPAQALAPLPRAFQRIVGAAYRSAFERLGTVAKSDEAPRAVFYYGPSEDLGGPMVPLAVPDTDVSADFSAELVAIVGAVPPRPDRALALSAIRLLALSNDATFRKVASDDLKLGLGYFHGKPQPVFAPVAITPDECGAAWADGRLSLPVKVSLNGTLFGQPNAGLDLAFDFPDLIAAAAQTRPLGAGTLVTTGTVSNRHDETPPVRKDGAGFASIAEARAAEKAKYGRARTPYLKPGDKVRIAVEPEAGTLFGAIDQSIVA